MCADQPRLPSRSGCTYWSARPPGNGKLATVFIVTMPARRETVYVLTRAILLLLHHHSVSLCEQQPDPLGVYERDAKDAPTKETSPRRGAPYAIFGGTLEIPALALAPW